jgi:hypothetical protein
LPEDVARWETNRVYNERLRAWRHRIQDWSATQATARARGEDTPSEPESSGGDNEEEDEDGEEGEVTPSPHSPLPQDLPSSGDIFSRPTEMALSRDCVIDWSSIAAKPCIGISWPAGDEIYAGGAGNDLLRVLQVPSSSPITRASMVAMVGPSSSGSGGAEPLAKKARPWSFLLLSFSICT